MWEYGGRSDPNRASPEELLDDEVWSHVGWVLQLRPREMVVGKPIPLNASIVSTLVRSLVLFMLLLASPGPVPTHDSRRGEDLPAAGVVEHAGRSEGQTGAHVPRESQSEDTAPVALVEDS